MSAKLTFEEFRAANRTRCLRWHPQGIESWSDSDWITAIVGELGELASFIKMRNRERDGLSGNKFSPTNEQIAKEAADVFTYLDLFCERNGIDLGLAAARKFNEVSERVGFPDRIELPDAQRAAAAGQSTATLEQAASAALAALDDMIERVVFLAGERDPVAPSVVARAAADALRQVLSARPAALTTAVADVLAERRRQTEVEGWTAEHDDSHTNGAMAMAAACYAAWSLPSRPASEVVYAMWSRTGWAISWFKPKDTRHNLVRAAALLLAEIERLDRITAPSAAEG